MEVEIESCKAKQCNLAFQDKRNRTQAFVRQQGLLSGRLSTSTMDAIGALCIEKGLSCGLVMLMVNLCF